MDSYTPSLADLEARLAKLERQNRRWKHLGLLFLLIAGSGFLLAQAPRKPARAAPAPATPTASYDTLVVHRLELRDKAGKLRGLWWLDGLGPTLTLFDAAGKLRAVLGVEADGPSLALYDTAGKPRAGLRVGAKGPELALFDAAGKPRAWLTEDSLHLEDAQQFRAVVGVTGLKTIETGERHTTSAAAVTLFDKDGEVIWRAP